MPGLVPRLSFLRSPGSARAAVEGVDRWSRNTHTHTQWRKKGRLGNEVWSCPEGMRMASGTEPASDRAWPGKSLIQCPR